ncbi:hypothetical protein Zmor_018705 [Zophobas morio]|uniref:Zinc finger PHD-type domain-containing protein n=1 Tax=Zophobas morio TaxID=2755281 RepID=A0AA38I7X0_9CUCU|nr:hypothetical protein Zmor_018705 [Zophobas morio]
MAVKCHKCLRTIGRTDNYISCKDCSHNYHVSCAGVSDTAFDNMQDAGLLTSFCCTSCKSKPGVISGVCIKSGNTVSLNRQGWYLSTNQFRELVAGIVKSELQPFVDKIDILQTEIRNLCLENSQLRNEVVKLTKDSHSRPVTENNLTPIDVTTKTSYAEAIAKNSQQTVIIKPKDKTQTVNKTKSDIMTSVDPVESSVNIGKVKNLKDGCVLLGCDDVNRFTQLAKNKLSSTYDIREIKTLRPRIRIAGISDDVDKDSVINYLTKQNEFIFDNSNEYRLLKYSPVKNKSDRFQAVIEVDIPTYKKAVGTGHCLIGLNSCSIFCGIDISRCFKCNGFNHSSKYCKNNLCCPRSTDKHVLSECKAETLCCINCKNIKGTGTSELINTDHAAWDHDSCHAYNTANNKIKQDLFRLSA